MEIFIASRKFRTGYTAKAASGTSIRINLLSMESQFHTAACLFHPQLALTDRKSFSLWPDRLTNPVSRTDLKDLFHPWHLSFENLDVRNEVDFAPYDTCGSLAVASLIS